MIVLIAGMQRSGSTFSFNIVRELLLKRGQVYQEAAHEIGPVIQRSNGANHVICKAHFGDDEMISMVNTGLIKAVCTVRRPEDAIASWIEAFDYDLCVSIKVMRGWLDFYNKIKTNSLTVPYELIDCHPWKASLRISRHVAANAGIVESILAARKFSKKQVKKSSDALAASDPRVENIGFSFYQKDTFFHRRHVSSLVSRSATERLGRDAVCSIRNELHDYLGSDGNLR